ncbi:arginine--tRNA ligase [Rathayibacter iranicus]|uniref:Arginine--tRNA ligase n=2 Tax=Rathayibacter iranicus TaxID=59737 RepID=A0AAD1AC54_9MICO|nr:arginine--tRNA ligase [Rathayibacter iranicus]AZZ55641.1 arginine--tRNA ligase [Rathayibacter iranicus]MWV31119.1 arginine--tRNA ligase [Rathayibacter iranicus NCPPB 2253 = VKM Ac-1602]PPI47911.1 arginine--tRNA ligase [Rathayibacter iranicus]PPI61062.1 arginine--tRNA ligase [Rathayibacter iranicus]PPI72961.1 arginine--tRNA ligase [Rathayibacter iranicus]
MTPEQLASSLHALVLDAVQRRGSDVGVELTDVVLERPKNRDHGDWASNIAMKLAKKAGANPRELAAELAEGLGEVEGVASVEVAGPGFLNVRLDAAAAGALAGVIVEAGAAYGTGTAYSGVRMNLEFVSANPTGPIHIGGTRWAAVGDSLARMLISQGAEVTREYYFNDHGAQIDRFTRSLLAAYRSEATPEDGYGGAYIGDIANRVVAVYPGDLTVLPEDELAETFRSIGVELMFGEIKQSLHEFGVDFDVYFHENALHESRAVDRAITRLRELGHIFEADGATWLRTTSFGDDRDRVIIKSDGEAAYIAGDLAYYLDKRERGFDRAIIMLGADHHGYIGRMMAMCAAFGDTPGVNLEILIGQLVNLLRDGEAVRMSKRAGTVVTMEDLVEAVGVDAARYSLVRSSADSTLDIDLDLLTKRSNDNPVYYVQYAHARTRQVAAKATASGVPAEPFAPETLVHPTESALLGGLQEFPRIVAHAAELREPHRVARYLEEIAGLYHRWYDNCRVVPQGEDPIEMVHSTRLRLNEATGQVLRTGLSLLGVAAPDRM